ncbi:glucosamine-fructose-6-phosphate aminotransferase, putative [Theileria equi strain WA]|uniref:glutamine--fructose-6-phosphate transaminase (isomerizing) n=1 Tax=Theileria equi strain WA TaxID=1537102 RepID=L1LCC3_THEEQ|nr:glucosamine-fructose-6-phosphate aminotransferase, putative [Theileria equi strain WA]EKX73097.1 glucosamine-fructose-6-phosphate aminotransferase, putative [Theileria equi strain WA]|eukprot:XP_004832549.1 glucosamine-fructose-6-phosphate aminotransferase, putative [Theileria equi strain WA]
MYLAEKGFFTFNNGTNFYNWLNPKDKHLVDSSRCRNTDGKSGIDYLSSLFHRFKSIFPIRYAECCGIVGYLGPEETKDVLLHGIKSMKHRGYDSCGICTLDKGVLNVTKCTSVGTPADCFEILKSRVKDSHSNSNLGIGHTRWATVGIPSDSNAHPHFDFKKRLSLVHNGTVSNTIQIFEEHYKPSIEKGEIPAFELPDSDSASIALFIGLEYDRCNDVMLAFKRTVSRLKGTWALCMISISHPNSLFVACSEAPLLFARSTKDDGIYIASEVTVFSHDATECIALEDGDIFELNRKVVDELYRTSPLIELSVEKISETPAPFDHWFLKEAMEQPYVARLVLSSICEGTGVLGEISERAKGNYCLLDRNPDEIEKECSILSSLDPSLLQFTIPSLDKFAISKLVESKRLFFVACGSSKYAAAYAATILQKGFGFESIEVDDSSDLTLYRYWNPENVVIHISNSGETLDCILAANFIKSINPNCFNISLVNILHSSLERSCESSLYLRIGRENSVPSTKAFSAQVVLLLLVGAYVLSQKDVSVQGSIKEDEGFYTSNASLVSDIYGSLLKFGSCISDLLSKNDIYVQVAKKLRDTSRMYIIGKGCGYIIAQEGALKFKEVSYIQAEAVLCGAMKHGVLAMISPTEMTPAICIITKEDAELSMNCARQLKSRGSYIICLTDVPDMVQHFADMVVPVPSCGLLTSALCIIPIQLIAYHITLLCGRNPDIPRGLSKAVTVL